MSDYTPSPESSKLAKTLLKDYFNGIRNLEGAPTLSVISLVISILFASKVFGFFVLNLAYLINVSFFALIARDSWAYRKKNPLPLVAILASIVLTSMLLIDVVKIVDIFSTLGKSFGN